MEKPSLILTGGRVFCGLNEGFVEAIAIASGRVLATGSAEKIAELAGPDTRIIELAGRTAIPGLNDAHMHLLPLGLTMTEINLRPETGANSIGEILRRVAEKAKTAKPGEWINGRGYDHYELAEKRHPTAEELDQVAPNNPVYLKRTCGHVAVINTQAMRAAGIGHNTPQPDGGMIERRDNKLTGLLAERALRLIVDAAPKPSAERLRDAIDSAGRFMLSQGFTSVMDAAVGMTAGMAEIEAYEDMARDGSLPLRTWVCIYGNTDGIGDQAHAAGYRFGREVGMLRYGAMKVFGDGSAGGLTAAMSEPYLVGDPDNRGIFCYTDKEMHDYLAHYHGLGYQLAIHAIGDAAIEQVLSGIEKTSTADNPILGRRHRIEHCGFLSDSQITRMAASGIDPVPQPVFMYEFGELYITNLGQARTDVAYPMRKWFDAGLRPAASSDAPVSTTDPFKNLFTMTTRKSNRHTVLGEGQKLSMEEAIHAYTYFGAYTQFAEDRMGRLIPGQLADIAVLSHDVFTCAPEEVEKDTRCDLTILGGDVVFDRLGQIAVAAE
ncbi:amidohydrolase [Tardiphaga sp. P9-11]|uniref:amidohydrolase n=1 Tax=Tardiphaga sp. P9-11 TaxID=2024614 RepID=UPI0011F31ECE|nr:amidohydrolase [Tardiphaga sp. P9-11]KAA0078178.1 amidohydrolase [Tardiphaga sp. P9-11]